jgi:hypothetical protein
LHILHSTTYTCLFALPTLAVVDRHILDLPLPFFLPLPSPADFRNAACSPFTRLARSRLPVSPTAV